MGGGRGDLGSHCFIAVELVPAEPSACPWWPHTHLDLGLEWFHRGLTAEHRNCLSGLSKVNLSPLALMTHECFYWATKFPLPPLETTRTSGQLYPHL